MAEPGDPHGEPSPGEALRRAAEALRARTDGLGRRAVAFRARIEPRIVALAGRPRIARVRAVSKVYGSAGGAVMAGGLAYQALFAVIPAVLLAVSALGFVVQDPPSRDGIVEALGRLVPPLRPLLAASVASLAQRAGPASLLGLAALVWGAGRFYDALDDGFARIFEGGSRRGAIRRRVRAVVAVGALIGAVVVALAVGAAVSFLTEAVAGAPMVVGRVFLQLVGSAGAMAAPFAALVLVYRGMPLLRPAWRSIIGPAAAVAFGWGILTSFFTYLAPRLVGDTALYGTIAVLFLMLAWLSLLAQLLFVGACWVKVREGPRIGPLGAST